MRNPFENEVIAIIDDKSWIKDFCVSSISQTKYSLTILPSSISLRHSWERFKNSHRIIVLWENLERSGGAIIEEIKEINPYFDLAEKLIVVTHSPLSQDVVYLGELGVYKILRLRNKSTSMQKSILDLTKYVQNGSSTQNLDKVWLNVQKSIDSLPRKGVDHLKAKSLLAYIERIQSRSSKKTARFFDAKACILAYTGNEKEAEFYWRTALNLSPRYFRSQQKLIDFLIEKGRFDEALLMLNNLNKTNNNNISRYVKMGEIYLKAQDWQKSEHYFNMALERDNQCSLALNGLAEIQFIKEDIESSRRLLQTTKLAYRFAQALNAQGIELVNRKKYKEALEHYTKAQYVLPQREKGAQLLFNIALCYYKWDKLQMAERFLTLCLIKDSEFKKARDLKSRLVQGLRSVA